MKNHIVKVLATILLIGFVATAIYSVKTQQTQIQIKKLQIKSTEAKLKELNIKYDSTLQQKAETEQQKNEQLEKIKQLENERERLQSELQAKLNKQQSEQQKLNQVAQKASGVSTAIAGGKADWMRAAGIPESEWSYVDSIVTRESGWNPNAVNKSSGACGLGQQLPCGKWAGAWNDPVAALVAMSGYVKARYGGWAGAVAFWNANRWY